MSWINDAREFLKLARDVREFLLILARCLRDGREERARQLLEIRIREQAAGRAAYEASHNAGRTVEP